MDVPAFVAIGLELVGKRAVLRKSVRSDVAVPAFCKERLGCILDGDSSGPRLFGGRCFLDSGSP